MKRSTRWCISCMANQEENVPTSLFSSLFESSDLQSQNELFIFSSISLSQSDVDTTGTKASFIFLYPPRRLSMESYTIFPNCSPEQIDASVSLKRMVFSVGMCVLPWVWMGFGCKQIILSDSVVQFATLSKDMLDFWSQFYNLVLLEYMYIHRKYAEMLGPLELLVSNDNVILMDNKVCRDMKDKSITSGGSSKKVLIPIGGGKTAL